MKTTYPEIPMNSPLCIITCYYGNHWPENFEYFLESCYANASVDFLIFTNIQQSEAYRNVRILHMALSAFNELASDQLGWEVQVVEPYKLNDFKPAYGLIFREYLTPYLFWGHGDLDLIYGNISAFLTPALLQSYDVISVRAEYTAGFFTLYKNTPLICNLFRDSKDHQMILQSPTHYCFDECNFLYREVLFNHKKVEEVCGEVESMSHVVRKLVRDKCIRAYFKTLVNEFIFEDRLSVLRWHKGRLCDLQTQQEYLLVHFVQVKNSGCFFIEPKAQGQDFIISRWGIIQESPPV